MPGYAPAARPPITARELRVPGGRGPALRLDGPEPAGQLDPRGDAELAVDVLDVRVHGPLGNDQALGASQTRFYHRLAIERRERIESLDKEMEEIGKWIRAQIDELRAEYEKLNTDIAAAL